MLQLKPKPGGVTSNGRNHDYHTIAKSPKPLVVANNCPKPKVLDVIAKNRELLNLQPKVVAPSASQLVSWYFEPSQPQRVTSWLKTMFNPSPIYSAHKSSNHKLSINHKIRHATNLHKTKHTQTSSNSLYAPTDRSIHKG